MNTCHAHRYVQLLSDEALTKVCLSLLSLSLSSELVRRAASGRTRAFALTCTSPHTSLGFSLTHRQHTHTHTHRHTWSDTKIISTARDTDSWRNCVVVLL